MKGSLADDWFTADWDSVLQTLPVLRLSTSSLKTSTNSLHSSTSGLKTSTGCLTHCLTDHEFGSGSLSSSYDNSPADPTDALWSHLHMVCTGNSVAVVDTLNLVEGWLIQNFDRVLTWAHRNPETMPILVVRTTEGGLPAFLELLRKNKAAFPKGYIVLSAAVHRDSVSTFWAKLESYKRAESANTAAMWDHAAKGIDDFFVDLLCRKGFGKKVTKDKGRDAHMVTALHEGVAIKVGVSTSTSTRPSFFTVVL